jgi:hypothetical protein
MMAALEENGSIRKYVAHVARGLVLLISTAAVLGAQRKAYAPPNDEGCKAEYIKIRTDSSASNRDALRLCVTRLDSASRASRLAMTRAEAMQLATMFFDIPEYHDEGRLAVDLERPGAQMGPKLGIYASPFLGGFTRPAQIYEQGLPGTFAAMVIVEGKSGDPVPASYSRLQLETGINCVYLYVDPPAVGASPPTYLKNLHYTARVTHPSGGACDRNAAASVPTLPVVPVKSKRFSKDEDYPAVARFDADMKGNPIMSVRCLNAFCEIGVSAEAEVRTPDKLIRSNQNAAAWDPLVGGDRKVIVKGWHDEQNLAVLGADVQWHVSDVRALLKPNPAAAEYDSVDFQDQWKTVGAIEIVGALPTASKYYKWGLRTPGDNSLQFQYNTAKARWEVRILQPNGAVVDWYKNERTVHYDVTVPAVARFRWTEQDDGIWAPCGNACCKATATQ